ncbi:MAG TPA: branched-chain amino acid ABC transporter permease [Actinophytocola sp.]|uniref:branched-chain amino acid ABC transporter permease n=1 Tax=Actinophytocola sp. TaxID=1872138 RepID=UPI002DDD0E55|nr:branched-chain amino acid ABC transporter permease [Actinophytocola sp.]HEV2778705.1 branched-chain amino acid ABC transporter permease [Actinophytocola sp.]
MNHFLTLVVNGLSLGCLDALIALGFVIVFKATRVVNFAYGSLLLLGAYVIGRAHAALGFAAAVLLALVVTAAVAALIGVVLLRRLRQADPGALAIVTLGVDIVLATDLTRRIGTDLLTTGDPWGAEVVALGGIQVPQTRVAAAVVAVVLVAGFLAVVKFTDWGIGLRASAERPATATLMGIRLRRVAASAWVLAGGLAAIAGLFFTAFPSPGITGGVGQAALGAAVPAAVLGGLDSTTGALIGGMAVGFTATFAAGYQDQLAFLGRGFGAVAPYVVMLLVLLVRPAGLFGSKEITRV